MYMSSNEAYFKCSIQANGDWMTISARSPDKEPSPPKQINFAEPLVESVRVYLANEVPAKQLALVPAPSPPLPPPPPLPVCHADIASDTAREDIRGINFEPRLTRNDVNNNASRRATMPSQAELMQRQPLLARNAKPEPQPTTDDSDPDQEHSPQRTHATDFVVEIPPGTVREERYPKEIWKTIVSFFFLFLCVCINMMSLSLVHERLPDRNTTPPLTDIVLDNVTARDWGLAVSEYLIMISTTVAMLVVIFHKHRFIVARRMFVIIGLLYLYRSVTMFVTVVPVSSTTYYCSPKSNTTTPLLVIRRMFYLISGFGLSINGKHTILAEEAVARALGDVGLGVAWCFIRAPRARPLHCGRGDRVLRDHAAVLDIPLAAGDAAPQWRQLQPVHDPEGMVVLAVHVPGEECAGAGSTALRLALTLASD
ncbi:unnamed protein product [Parnassius apollo]|uniref:(apollo) hypothetical protein n=1 Tax=Parnassius apollo TaxID=110799 RepID=A0A8S3X6Q7_PARAO|nr:unnamed protein product [Parnassius apollo]